MTPPSPTTILGIDPGYGTVGWGAIENRGSQSICKNYGCIKTKPNTPFPDRLLQIYNETNELIQIYKPTRLSIEKLFFKRNTTTALDVSQARGVILLAAKSHNIPIYEFTPLQVKQAVAGFGQAEKMQVQKMVKMILGLSKNPSPDDAADALAVAICAIHIPFEI